MMDEFFKGLLIGFIIVGFVTSIALLFFFHFKNTTAIYNKLTEQICQENGYGFIKGKFITFDNPYCYEEERGLRKLYYLNEECIYDTSKCFLMEM